jgi:hypothetical protein
VSGVLCLGVHVDHVLIVPLVEGRQAASPASDNCRPDATISASSLKNASRGVPGANRMRMLVFSLVSLRKPCTPCSGTCRNDPGPAGTHDRPSNSVTVPDST